MMGTMTPIAVPTRRDENAIGQTRRSIGSSFCGGGVGFGDGDGVGVTGGAVDFELAASWVAEEGEGEGCETVFLEATFISAVEDMDLKRGEKKEDGVFARLSPSHGYTIFRGSTGNSFEENMLL